MALSSNAQKIYAHIHHGSTKLGDLKKIAKAIKKDHALALELWSTGEYFPRLLATLIMDPKLLSQALIDELDREMQVHTVDEQNHVMEWLMANQLMKNKKIIALIQSWENSPSTLQRRTFWYYQARLRWAGQTPPPNTPELLSKIEMNMASEVPEVQWAMNLTAAWIGVFDESYRNRCIKIGEQTGLYRDDVTAKGCTPRYLPAFIEMEVEKRKPK